MTPPSPPPSSPPADPWASPTGTNTSAGTEDDPLDLATALGAVGNGHTVHVISNHGAYVGDFTVGQPSQNITMSGTPGVATIDGTLSSVQRTARLDQYVTLTNINVIDTAGGGPYPAAPTDIADLVCWLKADALALSDGDPVASWTDSSGNGHHFVQATSGHRPTFRTGQINGHPGVVFDGVDDRLTVALGTLSQPLTIMAVAWFTAADLNNHILFGNSIDLRLRSDGSPVAIWNADVDINVHRGDLWADPLAPCLIEAVLDGGSSFMRLVQPSRTRRDPFTYPAATLVSPFTLGALGVDGADGRFWPGPVAEFIIWNRHLTETERVGMQNMLKAKYGITA